MKKNLMMEEIIKNYGAYIYDYAWKLTCHPQQAEDLAQETFIQAWKHMEQLKEEAALKKWLRTICYHQFLMNCRKKDEHLIYVEDMTLLEQEGDMLTAYENVPEEAVLVKETVRELQNGCFYAMVRRLTLSQRIAFSLVDMFGMTTQEAAEMLEVSKGALKGLLYRARMNLDSFFADHCNLLHSENPCSCEAWIAFRENHEKNIQQMRNMVQTIDYRQKGYLFDEKVRGKISYLYSHMPEKRPGDEWFQRVIAALED